VVKYQRKEEIQQELEKQGINMGSRAMIAAYQQGVTRVLKHLTKTELEEAAHLAEEWNNTKAPPEVQAK